MLLHLFSQIVFHPVFARQCAINRCYWQAPSTQLLLACNFISIISQHKRAIQLSDSFCTDCKKTTVTITRLEESMVISCAICIKRSRAVFIQLQKATIQKASMGQLDSKCQDFESSYDIRDTLNYDMFNHSKTYVASFLASHFSNPSNQPKPLQPTQTNRSAMAPRPAPKCKVFGGLCA